jgi:GNAT superfamily N-acetyltransferase
MVGTEGSAAILRDGRPVTVSASAAADAADVAGLLALVDDPRAALRPDAPMPAGSAALIARSVSGEEIVGYAVWSSGENDRTELLCAVAEAFTGVGLGTLLLRRAAASAYDAGVRVLRVELHPQARGLAAVLRDCGFRSYWDLEHPVAHVDLLLATTRPGWVTP